MLNIGQQLILTIESAGMGGQGVARHDGQAVFIGSVLEGEEVVCQITKVNKKYAFAKVIKVIKPSLYRIKPICPIYFKCGGCDMQHIDYYAKQLTLKRDNIAVCLKKTGIDCDVDETVPSPKIFGYRNKAQVPLSELNGKIIAGYYRNESHIAIPFPPQGCALHDETTNKIIDALVNEFNSLNMRAYNESEHKGLLRHLVIRRTDAGYAVTVVINGNTLPHTQKITETLDKLDINYSLSVNINSAKTNVILGDKTFALHGNIAMPCNICGVRAQISPQSFMQVNDGICSAIYARIEEIAKQLKPRLAIDAYGGIGIISNLIAKYCLCVKCIEIVPSAIDDGKNLAKQNGNENKIENVLGDCAEVLPKLILQNSLSDAAQNTLIILDPPRKGCEQSVLDAVVSAKCNNVIYISCNPATLARDLQTLCTAYNITSVTPYDMFAQTSHIETLVLLSRK